MEEQELEEEPLKPGANKRLTDGPSSREHPLDHCPISSAAHSPSHDYDTLPNESTPSANTQSHDHNLPVTTKSHDQSHDSPSPLRESQSEDTEHTLSKLYEEDSIGETVFSKAWVLSVLVEIIKTVEDDNNITESVNRVGGEERMSVSVEEESNEGLESGNVLELEEELEGRVCTLWDASMNNDVADYIHEQGGVDLLLGAACRSKRPRLTEICLGTIGNLLCSEKICVACLESPKQRNTILGFLQEADSGVLCQTTRMIQTCLSFQELQYKWLPEITDCEMAKEALLFILKGSTNDELLSSASVLLDLLLNSSDQLLKLWTDEGLVEALCEAAEQSRCSNFEVTCTLIATLHTLTSVEEGVKCVLSCAESVGTLLSDFLSTVDQLESLSTCITPLTAACSLWLTLMDDQRTECLNVNLKAFERIQKRIGGSVRTEHLAGLVSRILRTTSK